MKAQFEFEKKHLMDSQTVRSKIICSDETKIEVFGLNSKRHVCLQETRHHSSPIHYHPKGEAWWWQHHALGVCFCGRDLGTGQG